MKAKPKRKRLAWLPVALVLAALVLALVPGMIEGARAAELPRRSAIPADPDLARAHQLLSMAEWTAIRNVIEAQREAFRKGDAERAYSFAAAGIQERFGDAPTFLAMVRESYAPLLDARHAEYLDGAVVEGKTLQPLRLVMRDETVLVAVYEMRKDDTGRWRIAGCVIAPSTVRST